MDGDNIVNKDKIWVAAVEEYIPEVNTLFQKPNLPFSVRNVRSTSYNVALLIQNLSVEEDLAN
jgi:hypothetical protein